MTKGLRTLAYLLPIAVQAGPFPQPTPAVLEERQLNCGVVNLALAAIKVLGPPATSFCSSLLKIPTATTSTQNAAAGVVTVTTGYVTVTTGACAPPVKKRWEDSYGEEDVLEKRAVPPALAAFAAKALSSGCSCLGLKPKSTVTTTITPAAQTVNTVGTVQTCTSPPPVVVEPEPTCAAQGQACQFDASVAISQCCTFESIPTADFYTSAYCSYDNSPDEGTCTTTLV